MRHLLLSLLVLFATFAVVRAADDEKAPEQPPATPITPGADEDTAPWNPELKFANQWPYTQAVHIDTEFYGPPGDFWMSAEYLLWWLKGASLPPLVSTGPAGSNGILGQPGVTTLVGGSAPDLNPFSGARITAGTWFDSAYTLGIEGNYFFLAQRAGTFQTGSPGSPVLARPFINATTGQPDSLVLASPALGAGSVNVDSPTELQGAEANLVWNLRRSRALTLDMLLGFRWIDVGSDLNVLDTTTTQPGSPTILDQFTVHNHFYGGQIGGRVEFTWRSFVLGITEKLALGGNTANINIAGTTVQTVGGVTAVTPTGLLAQTTNIGTYHDDTFAVVNEIGIQAGWQVCDYVKLFAGYSFLIVSSVVRAPDAVDLTVNTNQAAGGPARPAFTRQETDFWAHGFNAGVEIRY
jgi:hypothetical protein